MERLTINEDAMGRALQQYLEDRGYTVHKLQMKYDQKANEFSAIADVEKE